MPPVTRKGTVKTVKSDPPGFTLVPTDPPPPPATIPFECTVTQLSIATAAWASGKTIAVTTPDAGGNPTNVEGI